MSLDDYPLVSDWLGLADDTLIVHTGKVDIGQRISTALLQIVHDELTLPFEQIAIAPVRTGAAPNEGMTSGSNSVEQSGRAVRYAASTLCERALTELIGRLGGTVEDWTLRDGEFVGLGTNHPIHLIDLIRDLCFDIPVNQKGSLRAPDEDRHQAPMQGLRALVSGSYDFVHDRKAPGMLHARVIRPPHARAQLDEISNSAVAHLEAKGMHLVRDGSFLAVTGSDEWHVLKAARSLSANCQWQRNGGLDESDVFTRLSQKTARRFRIVDSKPTDEQVPPELSDVDAQARYERPFTLHGSLAPSAAFAQFSDGCLKVETHSQGIYPLRDSIADSLGLAADKVELTHVPGAGCYGHNGADDAAFEAALVAVALPGTPILLKWTREEEHSWEPFGSAMAVELAAKLGPDGRIEAYSAEAISGTHRGRPRAGPARAGPGRLLSNPLRSPAIGPTPVSPNRNRQGGIHRNLDPVYTFSEKRLVKNLVEGLPHRTSALRCLGGAANIFALECFLDELADSAGQEPIEYRLDHLTDPRGITVLKRMKSLLAERPVKANESRGIAYAQYKNAMTRVAVAVDINVNNAAKVRLQSALMVADAGRVVDHAGLEAQLEGGFLQAVSWALHEEVTWDRDGITSIDWETYPVLRFDDIPEIEVVILDKPGEPSVGAGEAAPGPTLAAIGNAVFSSTGLRIRRLPFRADAIRRAALES